MPGTAAARSPSRSAEDHRFALLRRLLHDDDADPRDRLAGCLLLLYAQPLTRTAALKTGDIALNSHGRATITLARGAIELRSRSARSCSRSATPAFGRPAASGG